MNSYTSFAAFYDKLMTEDFNYAEIADFIENIFGEYDIDARLVCELACGTGNITIPLSQRGYDMIAIDKSTDMLDIAREKAGAESGILFLNQDMTKIDLYGTVDAVVCLIDGINYVLNANSLFKMMKRIKTCFLEPGGIFLFDISSERKLKSVIGNNTFINNGDDVFYTWENRYLEKKRLCDMYLNFFVKSKKGLYRRFAERHLQRAYSADEIVKMLYAAGFEKVDMYDGMSFNAPNEQSDRIVFAAR